MERVKWKSRIVHGRDEVLRDIKARADTYGETVLQDARDIMHDYEVDMYRLVMSIGKRYGMDEAYDIMSDTVADKRLRWLEQVKDGHDFAGTDMEKGLAVNKKYFRLSEDSLIITKQSRTSVEFKRKDFVDALGYACGLLGLDVVEVNNKVYAKTMNLMFQRLNLGLTNRVLGYLEGWYEELIEVIPNR